MFTARPTTWLITLVVTGAAVALMGEVNGAPQVEQKAPPADPVPVGVAKVDITPEYPVQMYGYAARKTESEGVAGRLMAKALVIGGDDGEGPAVLLTVDNGAVPVDMRQEVFKRVNKKVAIKPERFMLSNAHVHSGPNIKGRGRISGEDREHLDRYARELTDRLEQVVLEALLFRRPGRLAWTQGEVGFAANRRVLKDGKWSGFGAVPDAPVDHSLPILRATDAEGNLMAVLVNYACHCTTLRGNFKEIHGDWSGTAQEFIEADHPGAIGLISIGCGADADPCPHGTVELCRQHGRALADEVKRLLEGQLAPVEPKLTARLTTLVVPYEKPPPVEEIEKRADRSYALQEMIERLKEGERPQPFCYEVATWVFGDDLAMVFLTGEVVVDYALRMKREMDGRRLWITAYTHDVPCYIVSKRLIGEGGYEVRNSLSTRVTYGRPAEVQPAMEERIIQTVRTLLPADFASPP